MKRYSGEKSSARKTAWLCVFPVVAVLTLAGCSNQSESATPTRQPGIVIVTPVAPTSTNVPVEIPTSTAIPQAPEATPTGAVQPTVAPATPIVQNTSAPYPAPVSTVTTAAYPKP